MGLLSCEARAHNQRLISLTKESDVFSSHACNKVDLQNAHDFAHLAAAYASEEEGKLRYVRHNLLNHLGFATLKVLRHDKGEDLRREHFTSPLARS